MEKLNCISIQEPIYILSYSNQWLKKIRNFVVQYNNVPPYQVLSNVQRSNVKNKKSSR